MPVNVLNDSKRRNCNFVENEIVPLSLDTINKRMDCQKP